MLINASLMVLVYGGSYQRICMMRMKMSHFLGFASTTGMYVQLLLKHYLANWHFSSLANTSLLSIQQVRGDDADDPTSYLVSFDDDEARYVVCTQLDLYFQCTCFLLIVLLHILITMQPLPTKLNLRKKRAIEGRSNDEVEHFPIPSSIAVRRRANVAAIELKEQGVC